MRRSYLASAAALLALTLVACSSTKKSDKAAGGVASKDLASENATTQAAAAPEDASQGQAEALSASGLPAFCTYAPSATGSGLGCFSCTPRQIPITGCAALSVANFDPAKDCKSDSHKMECAVGATVPFKMNFDKQTLAELAYSSLPLLVTAGKAFIAQKLVGEPQLVSTLNKVLDLIAKDKDLIFKPGAITPFIDELEGILKVSFPIVGALDVGNVKDLIGQQVAIFRSKLEDHNFGLDDVLTLVQAVSGQIATLLPNSGASSLLSGLNMTSLLSLLGGSQQSGSDQASLYSQVSQVHALSLTIQSGASAGSR